ncbi:MAG: hypothetical protein PHH38_05185 [Candidatus Cloacimonetes bacterium]|nr:hypothetical protein [Candidatus Cloacimonadota bacterium]
MKKIEVIIIIMLLSMGLWAESKFRIETELGAAFTGYNDVRSPNKDNNSPLLSFKDELETNPGFSSRLLLHYQPHPRHRISLLAAPLTLKPKGILKQDIMYEGVLFNEGESINAEYRFDSYRLGYRYIFPKRLIILKSVGVAAKIRDAEILLESTNKRSTKTNTGFVPLINMDLGYKVMEELELVLEAEGLGSPYGRAEDVYLGLDFTINNKLNMRTGYRLLEGGSDNDEVYTFAAIHYATVGFSIKL